MKIDYDVLFDRVMTAKGKYKTPRLTSPGRALLLAAADRVALRGRKQSKNTVRALVPIADRILKLRGVVVRDVSRRPGQYLSEVRSQYRENVIAEILDAAATLRRPMGGGKGVALLEKGE